jgi:RHS repeat-associated protein
MKNNSDFLSFVKMGHRKGKKMGRLPIAVITSAINSLLIVISMFFSFYCTSVYACYEYTPPGWQDPCPIEQFTTSLRWLYFAKGAIVAPYLFGIGGQMSGGPYIAPENGYYQVIPSKIDVLFTDPASTCMDCDPCGHEYGICTPSAPTQFGWDAIVATIETAATFIQSEDEGGYHVKLFGETQVYAKFLTQNKPEDNTGKPDDATDPCSGSSGAPAGAGSPVWWVNKVNLDLYVADTPLWYKPAFGPSVELGLSYNSQAPVDVNAPFGNKWTFNYGSYLTVGSDNSVTVVMPDGRQDIYKPDGQGGYSQPLGVFNTLRMITSNNYQLTFLNGTVFVYDIPPTSGLTKSSLTQILDAYGLSLTFAYQAGRITTITDAQGNVTTLDYDTNGSGLVRQVTDPFGRFASFQYDASRNLTNAQDMGGYVTVYTYDTNGNSFLASITNPKGKWLFLIEPSDNNTYADAYPAVGVGASMGNNYRITMTDPLGHSEEYYYYGTNTWYVSPRDYVTYVDPNNNNNTQAPKTYYMLDRTHPLQGKIGGIVSPEGRMERFTYDSVTGKVATVFDGNNHSLNYQYNSIGLITKYWDANTPNTGAPTTSYSYYPNNIDVQLVTNGLGSISYQYNASHAITEMTDRMGVTTDFRYNDFGQLTTVVEAANTSLATTTTLNYDPAAYTLQTILKNGNLIGTFAHDNIGRLSSSTYADGVTINYLYEKLNQIKTITYPDQKTEQVVNNTSCPYLVDSTTDRAGLTTSFTYDGLKRLSQKQGPDGTYAYGYDANGNLVTLTDPGSKTTAFGYDLDNRLAKKTYADTSYVSYTYDPAGLLKTFTNGRLNTTTYGYDVSNNLLSMNYSDFVTPNVTMTYDPYNRLATRTDTIVGLYQYTYDANNRITAIQTPWDGTTSITFNYDGLNRLTSMTPLKGTQVTYGYNDPLGRLNTITQGNDTFTYSYVGNSTLIGGLLRPNSSTAYQYNDPLKRLTSVINKNPLNSVISQYDYTYNNLDLKGTETITNGLPIDNLVTDTTNYTPNNLNQIASSTNPARTYGYNSDGNMTTAFTPDGYQMALVYDAENRLTSAQFTDGQGRIHLTNYYYSGDGLLARMTKKLANTLTSDIRYVRAGFLPVQERDGNNNVTREYLWGKNMGGGIGGLLNLRQNGNDYYYLYDGKGNVTSVIDVNQNVVASYAYDPFGVPMKTTLAQNFSSDQPFKFSTKQYDAETGLSYFGFRFYDPTLGRWINRDPLGEKGDINLYRAVQNNPVNNVDPWGLFIFGYRPLSDSPWIPIASRNPIDDYFNTDISHEQGFFEDGSGDNVGFGPNGRFSEDPTGKGYRYDNAHYDDNIMREALKNIQDGTYSNLPWKKNNCQDWAERLRDEYDRLKTINNSKTWLVQ